MTTGFRLLLATLPLLLSTFLPAQDLRIPAGKSRFEIDVLGNELELYCYKPANYSGSRLIVVMHGVNRNADEYRDHACEMADRFEAMVVAPKFDTMRFPSIKYNRGGILTEDKQAVPEKDWTYQYIPALVDSIRKRESNAKLKFWIIGHSAGGQFVARMSAFLDIGAERMVASNPGSHLFPTRELPFGYGFGELPESLSDDQRIRSNTRRRRHCEEHDDWNQFHNLYPYARLVADFARNPPVSGSSKSPASERDAGDIDYAKNRQRGTSGEVHYVMMS